MKQRDDLCVLSENQKIFMIGFDLLYPGQYKVVVKFCNKHVTNSPFKFHVSSEVEMKDFKKDFTEMEKHLVVFLFLLLFYFSIGLSNIIHFR